MPVSAQTLTRARKRLVQMHYEAGVGHLGGNLSCLDALLVTLHEYVGPQDRFILSKGHSAGALYVSLWSLGKLADTDLARFHQDDTLLAGHPPAAGIDDIRFATGSLGHGLSLAAGTALAFKFKQAPGQVYCVTSDGEWQEGSTWEALIFALHHNLTNLTILVDHNNLQGFGRTDEVASMSPLADKLSGFELDLRHVDGHDLGAIRQTLDAPADGVRLIMLETVKGHGISFLADTLASHYLPLDESQYRQALQEIESL